MTSSQDNKGSVRITEPFPYLGSYNLDELDLFLAEVIEYETNKAKNKAAEPEEPTWTRTTKEEKKSSQD